MTLLLHQTHIGANPDKKLTLIDIEVLRTDAISSNPRRWKPTGEAFIFRLPDELIVLIVDFATAKNEPQCSCSEIDPARDRSCTTALSLVCSRLTPIAQPLLFRNIRFDWPISMAPPSGVVTKLWRTLSQNACLRQHVRFLSIHIPDFPRTNNPEKYDILKCFASWLTRVQCMFIHGGFEGTLHREHTWNLILRFSKNMKELQHLRLSREGFGLHLQHITPYMARFPELRRLSVHGITEAEKMQKSDLESRTRTSPITELSLSDYEEGRIATRALIAWPKTLTHFTFGSFYNNKHTMDYTDFESWLSIHNLTLKSVDIGYLSGSGSSRLFNAMPFPNLESLKLSRWQQGWPHRTDPLRFKAEDANVLGQRVKFFGWDFGIYDQHSESWNAFGEDEEVWLTSLAKIAAAKKAALRTIKIYFRPDSYEVTEENGYPWDRMDRIRDKACKNNGIELEYTPPTITKENWLDALDPETRREDGRMTDRSDEHWSEPGEGSPAWREDEAEVLVQAETHLAKIEIPEHYGRDIREYFPRVQHPEA